MVHPHPTVQKYADAVLAEVFPCMVSCGLVEDRWAICFCLVVGSFACCDVKRKVSTVQFVCFRMDAYTLQICGEKSFISGQYELIHFKDIRR